MDNLSSFQILDHYTLSQLDKFYSKFGNLKQRVSNELKVFASSGAYINIDFEESTISHRTSSILITIIHNNEDNNVYQFTISTDYPFKPPLKFMINYKDYKQYLKIDSPKTIEALKKYNGIQCLCCNTISCGSNWSPSLKIQNFIDEFKQMKKYRRDIINRLLVKKIVYKYLVSDINLLEWLL